MSREEKQQTQQAELQKQLWSIANTLRGNMDANDFKNYILGLIFYRYLSENLVNYVERNKIKIPTTIEIDKFKLAFDPNNENESLVLKVRLTLKLTDELQSMDLTKHSLFWNEGQEERDRFISVQCLPSEGFENAKQSGDPVITYLPEGIQIDLKFDLITNNETTLENYKDHKYDLVFTFNGSKLRYYYYYETNDKGDIIYKTYNFFTAADSPLTNVDEDEDGGSHIFDIQSLLTVNPD